MVEIVALLVPLGVCVVLPVLIVWLIVRSKINKDNTQKEILLAAIEKNSDLDIEKFIESMNPQKKLLKEKLLNKMLAGMITLFIGLGLAVMALIISLAGGSGGDTIYFCGIIGTVCIATGIAFLINYSVGRKFLAKEMETEEQQVKK